MKKTIKKLLLVILFLCLPFLLVGCEQPGEGGETGGKIEYYLTPLKTEYEVYVGETVQIEFETNIEDGLIFESFDENYANVDQNGLVTAIKKGTAIIYAYFGNLEMEVTINIVSKPAKIYKITIEGYDVVETTHKGVALKYLLTQTYGSKMHPSFVNHIFKGYYSDKECTKELNLNTKIEADITIYPKLVKDTTQCDLMFEISETLFYEDEVTLTDEVQVFTPDFGSTVAFENQTYENCMLAVVTYDYNNKTHKVIETYIDGNKSNVKIPYNGFVIVLPKSNSNYSTISEKLNIGQELSLDRYSIIVANRIYINKVYEKTQYETISLPLSCQFAAAYDYTNQQTLLQENADSKAYPASTNKIITAIAAVKNAPLDLVITVGDEMKFVSSDSSVAGCKKGQVWKLRDLLYGLMLPSGNDAAYAIAAGVARSLPGNENKSVDELVEIFAGLMNEVRDELGATGSNFRAPDGNSYYEYVDGERVYADKLFNNYVTANDMIKFAEMAFNCPVIATVVSTLSKNLKINSGESFTWTNTNQLINPSKTSYYKYAVGMKTGTTTPGGQCLIFAAEVDGRFVICSVLKSTSRYTDATLMLRNIFN